MRYVIAGQNALQHLRPRDDASQLSVQYIECQEEMQNRNFLLHFGTSWISSATP